LVFSSSFYALHFVFDFVFVFVFCFFVFFLFSCYTSFSITDGDGYIFVYLVIFVGYFVGREEYILNETLLRFVLNKLLHALKFFINKL
jgi:hypothetical protein